MRRVAVVAAVLVLASLALPALAHDQGGGGVLPGVVGVTHAEDRHSENMELVGNLPALPDGERAGTDLAFWGNRAIVGTYTGGFRVVDISKPWEPRHLGTFSCPGRQSDVSVWGDLVFVSVDDPHRSSGPDAPASDCGSPRFSASVPDDAPGGTATWEGIRIVDISNPRQPTQVAAVDTQCGSHTHTLVPDLDEGRLLLYVNSYPLNGQGECNAVSHRKLSIVAVPLGQPETAEVVAMPDVGAAIGCHDVTVLESRQLAAAACITESQLWDISNPLEPEVLSTIRNPSMQIHHSTAFSNDGETLVIGDEMGGAIAASGCTGTDAPLGALWFYDVSEPDAPEGRAHFTLSRTQASEFCTAHNFNVVPLRTAQDVLVAAWYNGGVTVIDFTDLDHVEEVGWFVGGGEKGPAAVWSAYWYRDHIYASNFAGDVNETTPARGLDVLRIDAEFTRHALNLPRMNPQTQLHHPQLAGRG